MLALAAASCTDEGNPDSREINLYFRNNSDSPVNVETYAEGILRMEETIEPMQSGLAYTFYTRNDFYNFGFVTDSLVIKYPNGRGYICCPGGTLCISSKPSPVDAGKEDFLSEGNGCYYILSQQDYADALDID